MSEIWKQITSTYSVSSLGEIRNDKTGRTLRPVLMRNGYRAVKINYRDRYQMHCMHRLVADAFLAADPARNHVNHIDGDKQNNHLENLEWCTQRENNRHAIANGLNKSTLTAVERMNKATRKPVERLCVETGVVLEAYASLSEACILTGVSSIYDCLSGRQKTAGGFAWRYMKMRVNIGEAA